MQDRAIARVVERLLRLVPDASNAIVHRVLGPVSPSTRETTAKALHSFRPLPAPPLQRHQQLRGEVEAGVSAQFAATRMTQDLQGARMTVAWVLPRADRGIIVRIESDWNDGFGLTADIEGKKPRLTT